MSIPYMSPYDRAFYEAQWSRSLESARAVLPLLLEIMHVRSAIDVGCGVGPWAAVLMASGVTDVTGIDGAYVDPAMLLIPQDKFRAHNLQERITLDRTFDLALCLEVAEHLPETRAVGFVDDLTRLAPCILFSAAIPGQGGTQHINERYPSYWAALFASHGYVPCDLLRPRIWTDMRIEWWYRQNLLIFARADHPIAGCAVSAASLDYVHPELFEITSRMAKQQSADDAGLCDLGLRTLLRQFPKAAVRATARRLGIRNVDTA